MSKIKSLIGIALAVFSLFSLSVNGQKNCRWENLPEFQKSISKTIKKTVNASISASVEKIYFVNEQRGFITGSDFVAATIDGGKTWKIKKIKPVLVNEIYFADENKGWRTLIGESTAVEISQTIDGGKTWKYLKEISESLSDRSDARVFGYAPTILKMRFVSDNTVWSVGLKKVGDNLEYAIWKSVNGGRTWETKYLSNDPALRKTLEASFIKLNDNRLLVSSNGLILLSEDDGESWKETMNTGISKNSTSDFFSDFNFTGESNVWAVAGESGKIFQSSDSGRNWTQRTIKSEDEDSYKFTSVEFTDSKTGWIAGAKHDNEKLTGVILQTIDGGKTWKVENLTQASGIAAMSKVSGYIYAVGNNGLMLRRSINDCVN